MLPEFLPRLGSLFGTGFYHVAFLVAGIFQSVRLLPREHPYLNPQNIGRFGTRHVIAEAASNLKFTRANIDQIVVFTTILAGIVLMICQFGLLLVTLVAQPSLAMATTANFADWFTLPSPSYTHDENDDVALILLDRIFGVRGIFNTCISTGEVCANHLGQDISSMRPLSFPTPIHLGLHRLFALYSYGIGIISLMIILYFVTTIIGETAVTGTPFGQRFNRAWAPVRLVMFFALLAPLNMEGGGDVGASRAGLNGAQLITLWTAKFGSNFASNAWGLLITSSETPDGNTFYDPRELIAIPTAPEIGTLSQFFTVAQGCIRGQKIAYDKDIHFYVVRDSSTEPDGGLGAPPGDAATDSDNALRMSYSMFGSGLSAEYARRWSGNAPPRIVIGEQDVDNYAEYRGAVKPICGELTFPLANTELPGALAMYNAHWVFITMYIPGPDLFSFMTRTTTNMAFCIVDREMPNYHGDCDPAGSYGSYNELLHIHLSNMRLLYNSAIQIATQDQIESDGFELNDHLVARGWAGAGIWFNKIAEINGSLVSAVNAIPMVKSWPLVMEMIKEQQMANADTVTASSIFSPHLSDNTPVTLPGESDQELARAYYKIYNLWSDQNVMINPNSAMVGNPLIDTINTIFGTGGLFNMRQPAEGPLAGIHGGNETVHPLALMASVGRSLVEAAIRNLGVAAGATLGGGLLSILQQFSGVSALLGAASTFLIAAATTTIMVGIVLGYILPFLPFVYMFFALAGWAKSIFEAMVAMPIWALAHIRIDGDGMPGPGATNGYFLLFEIFIRPVLILIGLISSLIIFAALVRILNQIFDIMVANVGGVNRLRPDPTMIDYYRGPIDELFYTIIYASIAYMMGLSCFKMIDAVPNNILRWMGVSVATFKESAGDPASRLSQTIYSRGNMLVGQVSGALDNNAGKLLMMSR